MLDVGRVCIKTAGREAGRACVIVRKIDANYVMVTGPKSLTAVKRRKCNIVHLEPLGFLLSIKPDAPDPEVEQAFTKENIIEKISMRAASVGAHKRPAAELMKVKEAVLDRAPKEKAVSPEQGSHAAKPENPPKAGPKKTKAGAGKKKKA